MTDTLPDWTPTNRVCPMCRGTCYAPAFTLNPGAPCEVCKGAGKLDRQTHRAVCQFVAEQEHS